MKISQRGVDLPTLSVAGLVVGEVYIRIDSGFNEPYLVVRDAGRSGMNSLIRLRDGVRFTTVAFGDKAVFLAAPNAELNL